MKDVSLPPVDFWRLLKTGGVGFLFDLRNTEEFEDWRIEAPRAVETLNIPQPDFIGEEESYLDRFPRDRRIVTICAHGDSSRYTAEWLREQGFDAQSLEGGMDAWSEFYHVVRVWDEPVVYQVNRVARGCLAYVLAAGGEAIVIDAARHLETITSLLGKEGLKLTYVFDTHLHADHISGGRKLSARTGAAYHIHPADAGGASYPVTAMRDGDTVALGGHELRIMESPGHTPGSISLLLDGKLLFTGDIVMKSAIGRPDLGGEAEPWSRMLHQTLFGRYGTLPDDVVVLPSHAVPLLDEDESGAVRITLGEARKALDLFGLSDTADFTARVLESLPTNPERYQEIRKVNLGRIDPGEDELKELEIGKNLCGMAKAAS